jgi:hypothetical protein
MAATRTPLIRLRWTARADRVAHAHYKGPWTLCGQRAIDERDAWPELRRCLACRSIADELGAR